MERRLRALDVARRAGAEALLASNPSTVAWLTGFAAEVDSGPSPFSLPPFALLAGDDVPILIVSGRSDRREIASLLGAAYVCGKPFQIDELVGEVERAVLN